MNLSIEQCNYINERMEILIDQRTDVDSKKLPVLLKFITDGPIDMAILSGIYSMVIDPFHNLDVYLKRSGTGICIAFSSL